MLPHIIHILVYIYLHGEFFLLTWSADSPGFGAGWFLARTGSDSADGTDLTDLRHARVETAALLTAIKACSQTVGALKVTLDDTTLDGIWNQTINHKVNIWTWNETIQCQTGRNHTGQ